MASAVGMRKKSLDEYAEELGERYFRMTGRRARGKLVDEYIEVTGYERRYGPKVLGGIRRKAPGKNEVLRVAKWRARDQRRMSFCQSRGQHQGPASHSAM